MAKQKSDFVSATGTTFEILKGLAEDVWELGGNDDSLRRIISDRSLRQNLAKLIVGDPANGLRDSYTVSVDYGQKLNAMIAAGRYHWEDYNITAEHFPVRGDGKAEVEITLVHFGCDMSKDNVLKELDARGLRPATLPELLALGASQPELQQHFAIIALGSVWCRLDGFHNVACLDGNDERRILRLAWCESDWTGGCRYAAVRKSA